VDELSQFPGGPHDDQVDCASSAHEYLTSALPVVAFSPDESLRVD
jgi:phage terminase large subunit-like protein